MGFLRVLWQHLRAFLRIGGEFLCDTCNYDYDGACNRPERPNATICPDYRSRKHR